MCHGGPLSYVLDEADRAVGELLRVTRAGGHVLASVMSPFGAARAFFGAFPELVERSAGGAVASVLEAGDLGADINNGHVLHLYRWRELEALLGGHPCRVVAASASSPSETKGVRIRRALHRSRDRACREPGALDAATHIVVVAERC